MREAIDDPQQHDDAHVVDGIIAMLLPTVLIELAEANDRDVAQLAERAVWDRGAAGSKPAVPT